MEPPKALQEVCSTALVVALDPSIEGTECDSCPWEMPTITGSSGGFLQNCSIRHVEQGFAKGKENSDRLWELSKKLVRQKFN
jgi:hypothetical protein